MPVESLAFWGVSTAAGALVKPVLEDLGKDFAKDKGKSWLGRTIKRLPRVEALKTLVQALPSSDIEGAYEKALGENTFVKAYGKLVKELVEVIDEELRNAGVVAHQTEAWAKDIQQLVRTDGLVSTFDAALTSSNATIDGLVLSRSWQQLAEPSPLPPDFDWQYVAQTFQRKLRKLRTEDADLRAVLNVQANAATADNTQRLAGLPPEFNLDGYRESLLEYHGNLKLELLDATGSSYKVRLWHVFVPQTVRNCDGYVPQWLEIPKEVQTKLRAQGEWDDTLNRLSEEMLKERRQVYLDQSPHPVLEVVNDDRSGNLVILGDPGSGKSTLLKAVALEWARLENATERQQRTLPLLIELGPYDRWECPNGKSFVRYLQDAQTVHRLDQFRLDERLKQLGGAVLLLDGLDEIFDPNRRKVALNDIHRFSNEYPATRIIVTSRVIGYDQRQLADAGFRHFMLQDLDEAQIHEFLDHWYTTFVADARERFEKQERLRRAVAESRPIRELAENPLLLTMMAILNLHQELPRDRVKLYERATEVLLHHWDFERLGLKGAVEYREKAEMLRRLADHMQNAPEGLKGNIIDGAELQRIFRDYLKNELELPNAYQVANELVTQLRERNFILCHLGADKYAFVHRTILEYFCASALVRRALRQSSSLDFLRDEVFAKHWRDETWHEVLRLIAGMDDQVPVEHIAAIIDFLLEQEDRGYNFHHLFLASYCCIEVRNPKALSENRMRCSEALLNLLQLDSVLRPVKENEKSYLLPAKVVHLLANPLFFDNAHNWLKENILLPAKVVHLLANPLFFDNAHNWLKENILKSSDEMLREAAIMELARGWPDAPDTLPLLKDRASQDDSSSVRQAAVLELARGWHDDPDTLARLKNYVTQDEDWRVRQIAIEVITPILKDNSEILLVLKDLISNDEAIDFEMLAGEVLEIFPIRQVAVRLLAHYWKDYADTLPLLKDYATQNVWDVRRATLRILAREWKENPEILPWLKTRANQDESEWVRIAALQEIARGWRSNSDTLRTLKACLIQDTSEWVEISVRQELARGWQDDPEVQKLLEQVEQEELEPETEELGDDDDFALAYGGGDGPTT